MKFSHQSIQFDLKTDLPATQKRNAHLYPDIALHYRTNVCQKCSSLTSVGPDAAAIDDAGTQDFLSWKAFGFQMLQGATRLCSTDLQTTSSFTPLLMQRFTTSALGK